MKPITLVIYALPILLGCSVPREAGVGSSDDFESHSAIYVCDDSDSYSIKRGEPIYIKGRSGQEKETIYSVNTQLSSDEVTEIMSWGSWNYSRGTAYIPGECAVEFSKFTRMNSLDPSYFAFDMTSEEKSIRKGAKDVTDAQIGFTYEKPAGYAKFMSDGRLELGSFTERVVDKSEMPNYHKDYGSVWGYGDFYYAKVDLGDGQYTYVVGSKEGRKIVSVFGGKPLTSSGVQSTRFGNNLWQRPSADNVTTYQLIGKNCKESREMTLYLHGLEHSLKYSINGESCVSSVYTVEITNSTGQTLYSFSRNLAEMYVSHAETDIDKSVEALKEAKILIHGVSLIPILDAVSPIEEEGQELRVDAVQAGRLTQSNDWAIGHPESFEGHNFVAYDPELSRYVVVSLIGS